MTEAWVYILLCSDGTYYTGSTVDLDYRIEEHQAGVYDGYTAARRPVKLLWSDDFPDRDQAFDVERQIKKWSRKKKEALMAGDFQLLHWLAACKNETHFKNRPSKKGTKSR